MVIVVVEMNERFMYNDSTECAITIFEAEFDCSTVRAQLKDWDGILTLL